MLFKIIILAVFSSLFLRPVYSTPLEDMQLLGKGEVYYLKFIKVYRASLYTEKNLADQDILSRDVSKCLLLDYEVSLGREDFVKAANTILLRQFTKEQLEIVEKEVDRLHESYIDVKDGDTYSLCYDKNDSKTTLSHNLQELVKIHSRPFAEVYFSIWLGNTSPLDDKLRDNLLARR